MLRYTFSLVSVPLRVHLVTNVSTLPSVDRSTGHLQMPAKTKLGEGAVQPECTSPGLEQLAASLRAQTAPACGEWGFIRTGEGQQPITFKRVMGDEEATMLASWAAPIALPALNPPKFLHFLHALFLEQA
jgi:hypothetical protein